MKMLTNRISLFSLATLFLVSLFLTVAPVWSADQGPGQGYRYKKHQTKQPIIKTGFFNSIGDDRIKILDKKSYRELSYIVAADVVVTYQGLDFDPQMILKHSIVQLVIIDVEVVEIILLQESS